MSVSKSLSDIFLAVPLLISLGLVLYFLIVLVYYSIPSIASGSLLRYSDALPSIYGSLLISTIAVIIALAFSIALTILINEYLPRHLEAVISSLIDVLAAFPTVIFGIWGLRVFGPLFRDYVEWPLYKYLGFLPPFSYPPYQVPSALLTGVVLGIMVTPFATSVIREAYRTVPMELRETLLSLGAGKWEIVKVYLLQIREAIIGGLTLSFGKAIGETAAVAMLIGGTVWFCPLTAPCEAIPSLIVRQLGIAFITPGLLSDLTALALILFIIGAVALLGIRLLVRRIHR